MVTGIWKTPQISDSRSFLAPFFTAIDKLTL